MNIYRPAISLSQFTKKGDILQRGHFSYKVTKVSRVPSKLVPNKYDETITAKAVKINKKGVKWEKS